MSRICAQPYETGILRDEYHYPLEAGGYRRIWTLLVRCIKPCIWGTRRLTYFGGRIRAFLLELATPGPDAVAVVAVAMSVEELGRGQALLFLLSFHFIYSLLIFFLLVVFDCLFWMNAEYGERCVLPCWKCLPPYCSSRLLMRQWVYSLLLEECFFISDIFFLFLFDLFFISIGLNP